MRRSKRRSRLRSTCKWGGAVLTVLLVVVWVGSAWWGCAVYALPTAAVHVYSGKLMVTWLEPWSLKPGDVRWTGVDRNVFRFEWSLGARRHTYSSGVSQTWIDVPFWFIALFPGVPAGWFWYKDLRYRAPGLCRKCGYDLHGAKHTVCPECGKVLVDEVAT